MTPSTSPGWTFSDTESSAVSPPKRTVMPVASKLPPREPLGRVLLPVLLAPTAVLPAGLGEGTPSCRRSAIRVPVRCALV
jgi:hypothetical protein